MGIKEVARSSSEAAGGVKDVNKNIRTIGTSIKEVDSGVLHIQKNANDLSKLSSDLKELVSFFNVGDISCMNYSQEKTIRIGSNRQFNSNPDQ